MKRFLPALILVACAAAHAEDTPVFKIELVDGKITPQRVEVPADKAFNLEIHNGGKQAAEFESKPLKKEKVIAPGKTTTLKFKPLKAGEYKFVEEFHEKEASGQGVIVAK